MCEQSVDRVLNVKRGRLRTLLGERGRTCCGRAVQLKEWAARILSQEILERNKLERKRSLER